MDLSSLMPPSKSTCLPIIDSAGSANNVFDDSGCDKGRGRGEGSDKNSFSHPGKSRSPFKGNGGRGHTQANVLIPGVMAGGKGKGNRKGKGKGPNRHKARAFRRAPMGSR